MKHKITILFIALVFLFLGNFQPLFCMSLLADNQLNSNVSQKPELNEIAAYDSIMLAQLKFAQTKSAQSAIKIDMLTKEKAFYQNQNKKLLSLINNYDDQNFIFLSIGFVIISLLAFVVFILWRERFRYKQQSMVLASLEAKNNLSQSQDLFLKDQNLQLNEVIVSKERELTALTMQLANIQDSIGLLVDKASLELKENKESKIHSLAKEIRSILSQKDYWSEFMIKFTQVHPNFNTNIKTLYPMLSSKDISFCSLIKLNLSNKEIANLLQVSHESVITKKYLLKKKLALSADQDLFQIVNNID
jgi:DNA-binding CsgD family transcriptional regulator